MKMQNGKYTKEQLLEKLEYALKTHETTNFDFKRQWSDKIEKTVCSMLNIIGNNDDAFIFIGIDDKTREILGTDLKDENHFNTYKFNIKPNINIDVVQKDERNIQVISIWNRYDKPYFQVNGTGQMHSVIMTRNNSASLHANPQEIEELYKYRLRIDEDVLSKIQRSLIEDLHNWKVDLLIDKYESPVSKGKVYQVLEAHYSKNPNYKILAKPIGEKDGEKFYWVDVCYTTTTLISGFYKPLLVLKSGIFMPPKELGYNDTKLHYNIALLLNMKDDRTIENFRETFEKACEENGITFKSTSTI